MATVAAYDEAKAAVKREYHQAVEEEVKGLMRWAEEGWQGETVETMERTVREMALRAARAAMECRLSSTRGYEGCRRECECGEQQKFHSHRQRGVETLVGTVRYKRAYYRCAGCGIGVRPLDRQLQVERGQFSGGMCKVMVYAGGVLPFREATQCIYESSGQRLQVGAETVRRRCEQIGAEITVRWEAERLQAERQGVSPAIVPARLVLEADGTMIPTTEGWKEAKVASVVSWDRRGKVQDKLTFARVDNPQRFGNRLWIEAAKRGAGVVKAVATLGDGAPWIWNQFNLIAPKAVQILDFYHLKTHLYDLAFAHYGAQAPKATAWVHQREKELLSVHPEEALQAVRNLRPRHEEGKKKKTETVRYLQTNSARLQYQRYQQDGWPIGSGEVEGAARTFVGKRMKVGGARWIKDNAQFILDLRSVIYAQRWDTFWAQRFSSN